MAHLEWEWDEDLTISWEGYRRSQFGTVILQVFIPWMLLFHVNTWHMAPEDRGKNHCTMCFNIEFSCRNCLACSQRLVGFNLAWLSETVDSLTLFKFIWWRGSFPGYLSFPWSCLVSLKRLMLLTFTERRAMTWTLRKSGGLEFPWQDWFWNAG